MFAQIKNTNNVKYFYKGFKMHVMLLLLPT